MSEEKIINGVNVDRFVNTVEVIKDKPGIAKFNFRAENVWIHGGHNRTTIKDFYGAGQEDTSRTRPHVFDVDEPEVLLGEDHGANPVEFVLTALAGCLTISLVYYASVHGIKLTHVESSLEGDIDAQGFLGLSEKVRNGYENVRVKFKVKGDAPEEKLEELVQLAQKRSPVFDIVTNPVPVSVQVQTN